MSNRESEQKDPMKKAVDWTTKLLSITIKNLLAALGLASLFEKTVDWAPLIEKAIDIYQQVIYPIWDFLLGWMGYDIPSSFKDILTLNILLIIAISSSKAIDNVERISVFNMVFDEIKKVYKSIVNIYLKRGKEKLSRLLSNVAREILQLFFNLTMSLIFIILGTVVYLTVLTMLIKNISKASEKIEKLKDKEKLKSLLTSTMAIFYGFIALLGLNYALIGI